MSETFSHTRGRASFELATFGRLYRDAYDPDLEIERFAESLLSVARAKQFTFGNEASPRLGFALDSLLPLRATSVRRYLRRDRLVADAFSSFLRFAAESAADAVQSASTIEEVADAVLAELDAFHAYIVGNDLVDPGYLAAEHALADTLLRRGAQPRPADPTHKDELRNAAPAAAENNLALAA